MALSIFRIFQFYCDASNNCPICIVLKSDQWKLVTTSDPLKAIVIPMSEAKRVTIDAFGVTSGYQFHWSRLRTIQIPLFSFPTTCEGPKCSSRMVKIAKENEISYNSEIEFKNSVNGSIYSK